jgi:phosphate transport system substrate-binding protein
MKLTPALRVLLVAALAAPTWARAETAEPTIPVYQRVSGVSGNLSSVGSDTLANLMTLWTEAFKREYPNVNIQVQAAGSSTAPPALTEGTANFGPMSREMKDKEIEAFETRHGYKPMGVRVAIDALAVYVHKDNPVAQLSIPQVDAIFSVTRRCGATADIRTWGQLGLTGSWATRPIQLYGRNSVSGTYGYFKDDALCGGDFKNNVNEQPGSASVVQAVTSSLNGIGYSGIGYKTSGVRAVPIAPKDGAAPVEATGENAAHGRYPLARYLFVYVNKKPGQPLPPIEAEFLKLVLSQSGQDVVVKDGYIPLPGRIIARELRKLN